MSIVARGLGLGAAAVVVTFGLGLSSTVPPEPPAPPAISHGGGMRQFPRIVADTRDEDDELLVLLAQIAIAKARP